MIINAKNKLHVVVELDASDVRRIMKGKTLLRDSYADNDESMQVEIYCSDPDEIEEEYDVVRQ